MARKYRPWSRAEYDRLEELVSVGYRYVDIANAMGRETLSVQGAAQRIGLTSHERMSNRKRDDWPEIDRMLTDCIEAKLMTIPQARNYMASVGKPINVGLLYRRMKTLPADVKMRARKNAQRRMVAVCGRMRRKRQAA